MPDVVDFSQPRRIRRPSAMPQFQRLPLDYDPSTPYTTLSPNWTLSDEERFQQFTTELVEKFLHSFLRNRRIDPPNSGPGRSSSRSSSRSLRLNFQNSSFRDEDLLDKVVRDLLFLVEYFEKPYNMEVQGTENVLLGAWFDGGMSVERMKRRFDSVAGNVYRCESGRCVNWSRIVAHFCFVAHLAAEGVERGREGFVELVAQWMSGFFTRELRSWISAQGGWADLIRYRSGIGQLVSWKERAYILIIYGMGAVALLGIFGLVAKKSLRAH